jgi:pimeloyl-ACP methyl ester carboxylesterase
MAAVADATITRWFTPRSQHQMPEEVARIREGILATSITGYGRCAEAIRDMDLRESIRALTVPTLVMVGALDPGTTVDAARLMHERIAGAELVVIPESQHFFNVEMPRQFNAGLLGFLARHP